MSDSRVELIEEFYAAWPGGMPYEEILDRIWAQDCEWHDQPELPDSSVHRGREALLVLFKTLEEVAGRFELDVKEIAPAGEEILTVFDMRGSGGMSGVPVELQAVHVILIEDGRIRRIRAFFEREDGIAAAEAS